MTSSAKPVVVAGAASSYVSMVELKCTCLWLTMITDLAVGMVPRLWLSLQRLLHLHALPSISALRGQRREGRTIDTFGASRQSRLLACVILAFTFPCRHTGLRVSRISGASRQNTRCMGDLCVGSPACFAAFSHIFQPRPRRRLHPFSTAGGIGSPT